MTKFWIFSNSELENILINRYWYRFRGMKNTNLYLLPQLFYVLLGFLKQMQHVKHTFGEAFFDHTAY